MDQFTIDINCDVGEGVGNEAQIFPYISSCNIACGGHAGDMGTMRGIASLAKQHGLKVGAHPSYPDKANFGREVMDISNEDLIQSIQSQLTDFDEVLNFLEIDEKKFEEIVNKHRNNEIWKSNINNQWELINPMLHM